MAHRKRSPLQTPSRRNQQQQPDAAQSATKPPPSDLRAPTLVLGFTTCASMFVLWYLGIFSTPTWPRTSAINHVSNAFDRSTFQLALDQAHEQSPLFVIFYSKHCVACRRIKTPFVRVAEYFQHAAPFYAVELSDASNRHYVSQFQIKHVPYFLVVTGEGEQHRTLYKGKSSYASLYSFVKTNLPTV